MEYPIISFAEIRKREDVVSRFDALMLPMHLEPSRNCMNLARLGDERIPGCYLTKLFGRQRRFLVHLHIRQRDV